MLIHAWIKYHQPFKILLGEAIKCRVKLEGQVFMGLRAL
jgi:hypothetical protein